MVHLLKALYVYGQFVKLWYDRLTKILKVMGFIASSPWSRVWNAMGNNLQITDDKLVVAES